MCSWCKSVCETHIGVCVCVCGGAAAWRLTAGRVGWPGASSGADSAASQEHWGARDWAMPPAKRWRWQLPASGARGHLELGALGQREKEEEGEREAEMKAKSGVAYAPELQCKCVGGDVTVAGCNITALNKAFTHTPTTNSNQNHYYMLYIIY